MTPFSNPFHSQSKYGPESDILMPGSHHAPPFHFSSDLRTQHSIHTRNITHPTSLWAEHDSQADLPLARTRQRSSHLPLSYASCTGSDINGIGFLIPSGLSDAMSSCVFRGDSQDLAIRFTLDSSFVLGLWRNDLNVYFKGLEDAK